MENQLEIYSDGGARGNPGPAACAFVVKLNGSVLVQGSKYLGSTTNNLAEYQGVVLALDHVVNNPMGVATDQPINFFLDSELVVRQLNGLYKTKNEALKKLNTEVKRIISEYKLSIVFKNIPRSKNKEADLLVNKELDRNQSL